MKFIIKRSALALAAMLMTSIVANAATPVSPALTNAAGWDCLITGKHSEQGILFLTFKKDNTLVGEIVEAKVAISKSTADRSGSSSDRDPATPVTTITNSWGHAALHNGLWWFDASGYTIGVFTLLSISEASETNVNQFSFKAKIASNKRITASYSSSVDGSGVIRGVPIKTTLPDLSGGWSATERNGSLTTYEWFEMIPANTIWPNVYTVTNGYGPGYVFSGTCMVSSQKKIGFGTTRTVITATETNKLGRATIGSFINKSTSLGGKTKGVFNFGTNVVAYDAFWTIPAPAP